MARCISDWARTRGPRSVEIIWPSRIVQTLRDVEGDRILKVKEHGEVSGQCHLAMHGGADPQVRAGLPRRAASSKRQVRGRV